MEFQKTLDTLGKIAASYPEASQEYNAIEAAAKALFFLEMDKSRSQFKDFINNKDRPLNGLELITLKVYGLEIPDENRTPAILELEAEIDSLAEKLRSLRG